MAGDMAEYWRRWEEGRWWWWLGPGGEMRYAGKGRRTRLRCPADMAGLADTESSNRTGSAASPSSGGGSSSSGSSGSGGQSSIKRAASGGNRGLA